MKNISTKLRQMVSLMIFLIIALAAHAQQPRNVILYIGDGYGIAPKTATRMALGQGQDGRRFSSDLNFQALAIDKLRYVTMVTTHSKNSWITDSAPGATVYAAGKKGKVNNEAIAFDMETNQPVETILENAKKNGYAVGLVTTTRVTHATPADFASHIWNRDIEDIIAAQYLSKSQTEYAGVFGATYDTTKLWVLPAPKVGVEVDVILGGGSRHFLPRTVSSNNAILRDAAGTVITKTAGGTDTVKMIGRRADNIDLVEIAKTRGYTFVNSRSALNAIDPTQYTAASGKKLLGLFNADHVNYEQDRQIDAQWEPSLSEMTDLAIKVLQAKSPKGFFLIVEGGRIDHLEHANAGGVSFNSDTTALVLEYDREARTPDAMYGKATIAATQRRTGIYGSDYLIKEVMAFDYAIEKGRALLTDRNSQTLIFSTSDHECGGTAIVGLHDEADAQNNGTKVRTYAKTPAQDAAIGVNNPRPAGLTPGAKWFPDYEMYDFQGIKYPRPKSATGQRIVISYGSNPLANGNGTTIGATPGNHTPQDIFVGGDDNVNGQFAGRITGRGLMDNTDLTPIMKDFLGLSDFQTGLVNPTTDKLEMIVFPNPSNGTFSFAFNLDKTADVKLDIFSLNGQLISTINAGQLTDGAQKLTWNGQNTEGGTSTANGVYIAVAKVDGQTVATRKLVKE